MHRPHNVLVERREERVVVDGREVLDDRSTYRQCDGSEDHRAPLIRDPALLSLLDPPHLFETVAADRLWAFLVPRLSAFEAGFVSGAIEAIETEARSSL